MNLCQQLRVVYVHAVRKAFNGAPCLADETPVDGIKTIAASLYTDEGLLYLVVIIDWSVLSSMTAQLACDEL